MSSKTLRMNERERKGKIKGKLKYISALRFLLQRVYKINIILESNKKNNKNFDKQNNKRLE